MKAVIYSCNDGTRLRPITCSLPHSMLPLMGIPLVEHTVRALTRHNITDITIASGYLSDEIKKHFEEKELDVSFSDLCDIDTFFKEDDVLLISDSVVTDINYDELLCVYEHSGSDCVIVTKHTASMYEYGVVTTGKDGFVTDYNECPDFSFSSGIPFLGIAVIKKNTDVCDCSNIRTLIEKLLKKNFSVYSYTPDCYSKNISDIESYHKCCRDFMDKKINLPVFCREKAPSVWIDEDATIMQGVVISPPVYIGKGSTINKGARIDAYSQICNDVTIDCHSSIKRTTIMDGTYICENVSLRGALVGKNCHIGNESAAYEGSVLGFGTKIGKSCVIRTSVHIWPDKFIGDEKCVSENVMWESNVKPSLFCDGVLDGIINSEITPESAATLARAVVLLLGEKIAVSSEGDGAGSMIKNALIAGIQSGGGKAYDMGEQPLPITRSAVRFYSFDGGIALSTLKSGSTIHGIIDIINSHGATLENSSIKKLESLIESTNPALVNASKIHESEFIFEYKLYYLKQLINSTSKKPLGAKILIHSPSVWACELLKSAASDLKCDFTFTEISDEELFSAKVTEKGFDMGAICDPKCETLTLVTKSGYVLNEFDYCALTSLIVMKSFPSARIYIPQSAPDSIEKLAEKYNAQIIRTKISPPHLMNELSKRDMKQYLHQFIYRFDAVGAIIILLDYFYTSSNSLESLMTELPPTGTVSTTVSCPAEEQKEIINQLYLRYHLQTPPSSDCIRINFENGWVLVVPNRDRSLIRVISHGANKEYASELADICLDEIAGR